MDVTNILQQCKRISIFNVSNLTCNKYVVHRNKALALYNVFRSSLRLHIGQVYGNYGDNRTISLFKSDSDQNQFRETVSVEWHSK